MVLGRPDRKGVGVVVASERGGRRLETLCLAGRRDAAVDLVPMILMLRDHLPRGFSHGIGQAGLPLERGVDFHEPVVDWDRVLEDHFEDRETLVDGIEQGLVALLAFAELPLGFPPRSDVDKRQDDALDPVLDRPVGPAGE